LKTNLIEKKYRKLQGLNASLNLNHESVNIILSSLISSRGVQT